MVRGAKLIGSAEKPWRSRPAWALRFVAHYDIVVSSAEHWACLNCSAKFVVLIGARP
jgi:hypothetical protein